MNICVVNLGCKVNRVESDEFIVELEALGHKIVSEEAAHAIIINTCAVTQEADKKTRKSIRHLASLSNKPRVYVTGCSAMLHKDELESLGDTVEVFLTKHELTRHIDKELAGLDENYTPEEMESPSITKKDLGSRRLGLKIQDGCDNRCSYCIIWKARGKAVSYDPKLIIDRVQSAVKAGVEEMVLTGINLGTYSYDLEDKTLNLSKLIVKILQETSLKRLRLSSIEPLDVSDELIETIKNHRDRVCEHLHMSLQSGCEKTLKEMGRIYSAKEFSSIVQKLKTELPGISISTDVIVGFPGETDKDFEESYEFCKEMGFSKIHVFRYSKRSGTEAAKRSDQIPSELISKRAQIMRELSDQLRLSDAQSRIGSIESVFIEHKEIGTSESYHKIKMLDLPAQIQVGDLVLARFESVNKNLQVQAHYISQA